MNSDFFELVLCSAVSFVLLGVLVTATLSYLWEHLESRSGATSDWGRTSSSCVVERGPYRSAALKSATPNAAPASVVALTLMGFFVAWMHIGIGVVGILVTNDMLHNEMNLLLLLFMSLAGVALFQISVRFMRRRRLRGSMLLLVQLFHSVAGVKLFMDACAHGGGRELLPSLFYGMAWLLVSAMWLSPFRAQSERS